jgi:hypothetical protein
MSNGKSDVEEAGGVTGPTPPHCEAGDDTELVGSEDSLVEVEEAATSRCAGAFPHPVNTAMAAKATTKGGTWRQELLVGRMRDRCLTTTILLDLSIVTLRSGWGGRVRWPLPAGTGLAVLTWRSALDGASDGPWYW